MNDNLRSTLTNDGFLFATSIVFLLTCLFVSISYWVLLDHKETLHYVNNGYEQVMLPGSSSPQWQKITCGN
jgi:hypothetical protein